MTVPVSRAMLASQAAASNRSTIERFPSDIGPHGILMMFKEYKFQAPMGRKLLDYRNNSGPIEQASGSVLLPIPNTLTDRTSLDLTTYDMGGDFGYEAAAATAAYAAGTYESNPNSGWYIRSNDILAMLKKVFGENFYLGAVTQGVGAALNPKSSLVFRGVDLKTYSFEWTLAPTSEDESELLRKIVRLLKANSLPGYTSQTVLSAAMLNYPATVDLFLLGVDPDHYVKFKTAMIRSVDVNYTPSGLSILRGGRPSHVTLSIIFQEMDIHTANDYGGGSVAGVEEAIKQLDEGQDALLSTGP